MAFGVADDALNRIADFIVNEDLYVRLHDVADPGKPANLGRIGTFEVTIAAGGWTDAATAPAMSVSNAAAAPYGVLSTSGATTVRAYSVWRSTGGANRTFVWWGNVLDPDNANAVGKPVAANEAFTINAGEIEFLAMQAA